MSRDEVYQIHEYDDVDLSVVWDAVTRDLPPLAEELARRLPPAES
jgi:uncharacterized protein with HEPN domain